MNVLAKMVIPRTIATIKYILTELEERAREDFFRLKKVLKIKEKRKKIDHNHEEIIETCPICLKILEEKNKEEKCITCLKTLKPGDKIQTKEEIEAAKEKINELKERLTEIVELTKNIEKNDIITASTEDFLLGAEDVKTKLEEQIKKEEDKILLSAKLPMEKLCKKCRDKVIEKELFPEHIPYTEEIKPIIEMEEIEAGDESKWSMKSEKAIEEVPYEHLFDHTQKPDAYQHLYAHPPEPPELGVFETEIKEITKIVRTRNEDGTVTEERKVLRIKKEIRTPKKTDENKNGKLMYQASEASTKSTPYLDHKTIGHINVDNNMILKDEANEIFEGSIEFSELNCSDINAKILSKTTTFAPNNEFDFKEYFKKNDSFIDDILSIDNAMKIQSYDQIEKVLNLFQPLNLLNIASTSTEVDTETLSNNNIANNDAGTQFDQY